MGETMTEAEWGAAVEAMRAAGETAGKNAASWIADGNTSRLALEGMLRAFEGDADPGAVAAPAPFSGEWASGPSVADVIGSETEADPDELAPEERDELATVFEDAYYEAFHAEGERIVRGMLGE